MPCGIVWLPLTLPIGRGTENTLWTAPGDGCKSAPVVQELSDAKFFLGSQSPSARVTCCFVWRRYPYAKDNTASRPDARINAFSVRPGGSGPTSAISRRFSGIPGTHRVVTD